MWSQEAYVVSILASSEYVDEILDPFTYAETIEELLSLDPYTVRHFFKSFEEFIELVGTSLFLVTFAESLSAKKQQKEA